MVTLSGGGRLSGSSDWAWVETAVTANNKMKSNIREMGSLFMVMDVPFYSGRGKRHPFRCLGAVDAEFCGLRLSLAETAVLGRLGRGGFETITAVSRIVEHV